MSKCARSVILEYILLRRETIKIANNYLYAVSILFIPFFA